MIRILQVIGMMNRAGAESMIMNLYRSIDRDQIQFDFLVGTQEKCDFDDEIESLGGHIYRVPQYLGINQGSYTKAVKDFFSNHHDYCAVHGHIGSCASIYLAEAKKYGIPTIAHSHRQNAPVSPTELYFRYLSRRVRGIPDEYLACSMQAGIDRFGTEIVSGEHYHILNNGIDVEKYRCTHSLHEKMKKELFGLSDETPLFGHVGRFDEIKNHKFLIEVFAKIKKELPNAKLALVGRGSLEEATKDLVQKAGLQESVLFLGIRDDIDLILSAFDAFIFPSIKEGLPLAPVEAQASGLPCAISQGVPSQVCMAESVFYLPLDDGPEIWAQKSIEAYELSKSLDREAGVASVRSAGFDVSESAQWLSAFYQTLAR